MCLNGWGGKLHEQLRDYLRAEQPDVLCLQEVVHTPASSNDWLTYRDGDHVLPQRANFFSDVREALPQHLAAFFPASQGVLWDGDRSIPSQWGLATFVRADYPIIGQHVGFVHKGFCHDGYGDHPRSRNAHVIRLYDFNRDWPITIAHMHGLRDLRGKLDTPERLDQARQLVRIIRAVAPAGERLVACGDFNVEPDSRTFETLAKELRLTDLVTGGGYTGTRTSHYVKAGRFADYMLVAPPVEVVSFAVVAQPEVSDHCPLILEV